MAFKQILKVGLWKNKSKNGGADYLGGGSPKEEDILIPANALISIFKNDRKEKETHPDYNLTISVNEDAPATARPAASSSGF